MYRTISTLPCAWPGDGQPADCGNQSYGIGYPYGFGWAAKGFTPDVKSAARQGLLHVEQQRAMRGRRGAAGALEGPRRGQNLRHHRGTTWASLSPTWTGMKRSFTAEDALFVYATQTAPTTAPLLPVVEQAEGGGGDDTARGV